MPLLTIPTELAGQRLDTALAKLLETTRSQIQKLIKSGAITLNQKTVSPHVRVQGADTVFYPELFMEIPAPKKSAAPLLDILYEDDDLLVINKPAGLLVHGVGQRTTEPTVVDALLERYPSIASVGDDPIRPGIVHRLDRDASGVLIIGKTQSAFEHLKQQFVSRAAHKEYVALAYGRILRDRDTITLKIARSRERGRMVARPHTQEGKEAITEYTVLERFKTATLVRVQTKTGRTHQIRAHFKAINHPLVGDKLYKKKHMKNIRPIELDRVFLHATTLTIVLPGGKERTFEASLPMLLERLLQTIPKL